ncbi:MAG: peptidoglycan DD-metalloendopeptidase family protein [Clostridiales bacterium]|nr:peptidoglycan DD-metalloendopeptidase family protein [Clostridiales bacterium]
MDLRRYKNVARKMGRSLADNTAKFTEKAFGGAEKAVTQIRRWKRRVSTRSSYVSNAAKSDVNNGGKAGAVHAFLTKPRNRRLLIADCVLVLILVVSLMPHGSTEAAAADLSAQRETAKAVQEEKTAPEDTFELTAATNDFGAVELSWEEVPSAPGYIVYRYNDDDQKYEPITAITDKSVTTYTDTEAPEGSAASYQVTPLLAFNQPANSNVVDVDVTTAKPEISLEVDGTDVSLSWTAVDGADQYTLLRAIEEDGEYAEVAYVYDPEFLDENMTSGRTYYYKVFAEKDGKVTETSDVVSSGEIPEAGPETYDGGGLLWPVPSGGYISSGFGSRYSPTWGASSDHQGIDISCGYGCDIVAAAGGVVTEVSYSGARGNYVVVSHGDTVSTLYQHLSATNCSVGQNVSAGDTIGYAGSTGISTGTHLHFEVHVYGTPVDPMGNL